MKIKIGLKNQHKKHLRRLFNMNNFKKKVKDVPFSIIMNIFISEKNWIKVKDKEEKDRQDLLKKCLNNNCFEVKGDLKLEIQVPQVETIEICGLNPLITEFLKNKDYDDPNSKSKTENMLRLIGKVNAVFYVDEETYEKLINLEDIVNILMKELTNWSFSFTGIEVEKKYCKHCKKVLIPSYIEEYSWQCMECDEDFFNFEALY